MFLPLLCLCLWDKTRREGGEEEQNSLFSLFFQFCGKRKENRVDVFLLLGDQKKWKIKAGKGKEKEGRKKGRIVEEEQRGREKKRRGQSQLFFASFSLVVVEDKGGEREGERAEERRGWE